MRLAFALLLVLSVSVSTPLRAQSTDPAVREPTTAESEAGSSTPAVAARASLRERRELRRGGPRRWEEPVRAVRRNALLLYPIAALRRGVTLGYERAMPDARFGLLLRTSVSFSSAGDFRSAEIEVSVEARYYALARGPFTRWSGRAPVGLYLGMRAGLLHSRLVDRRDDRLLGTLQRLLTEFDLGYRFVVGGRVEIAPWFGALFYADFIADLPAALRPNVSTGATVGWLF